MVVLTYVNEDGSTQDEIVDIQGQKIFKGTLEAEESLENGTPNENMQESEVL